MANEIGKFDALTSLTPDADFGVKEDGTISWKDYNTIPQPSDEEINNEVIKLQAEYDALDYARARDISYPNLKEFAEAYTEKEIGGDSTKWDLYVTKYNKVRTDNPKG